MDNEFSSHEGSSSLDPIQGEVNEQLPLGFEGQSSENLQNLHLSGPHPPPEDDQHSNHSDSWEVITRMHAELPPATAEPASPAKSASAQSVALSEEGNLSSDTFLYSIATEDVHSDADTHRTDDLLRRGELDYHGASSPALTAPLSASLSDDEDLQKRPPTIEEENYAKCSAEKYSGPSVAAAAACFVSAAHSASTGAGRLVATLAGRLRALAAKVRAYVAQHQPEAQRLAGMVVDTVQELARSLQLRVAPGVKALSVPLSGATVVIGDVANALVQASQNAVIRVRKGASSYSAKDVDWVKVALLVGCAGMVGMLWRLNAANARLAARLSQREGELAELVARIVALQRNITSQRVPIIRHTTSSTLVAGGWPAVVQAI